MKKTLCLFAILFSFVIFSAVGVAASQNMTGVAPVNVTSDTAATAKVMALSEARRQIITDILSKYANAGDVSGLVKGANDAKLTNMISSTSIDGERQSATTYSANIKMTLDAVSSKQWLDENDVQNWLGDDGALAADMAPVVIDITDGLRGWVEFGRLLHSNNLNLNIKRISGGQVTGGIPTANRAALMAAVRNGGWKYSDTGTFLRIWR